jgi:predicted ATPase with chaperone activity
LPSGRQIRPGEITLAHRGVLFLDELPEFPQAVLEVLRQPLEDKVITISRASGTLTFPSNFILVAAQNPCPCGYYGDSERACTCAPTTIARYEQNNGRQNFHDSPFSGTHPHARTRVVRLGAHHDCLVISLR